MDMGSHVFEISFKFEILKVTGLGAGWQWPEINSRGKLRFRKIHDGAMEWIFQ